MVDSCPVVKWFGIWMVAWKLDWKSLFMVQHVWYSNGQPYNVFTIWIPVTHSVRYSGVQYSDGYCTICGEPTTRHVLYSNGRKVVQMPSECHFNYEPLFKWLKQDGICYVVWYSNGLDYLITQHVNTGIQKAWILNVSFIQMLVIWVPTIFNWRIRYL